MTDNKLKSIIERIERLEEEKAAIAEGIRAVYSEAKSDGYEPKALRHVVRMRAKSATEREQEEALIDTYMSALGML